MHFQFYKTALFTNKEFLKTQANELFSLGINLIGGGFKSKLRHNVYGPIIRPSQLEIQQNHTYIGAEFETIITLIKIEGVVLQYAFRIGMVQTVKKVEYLEEIKVFPGLGIQQKNLFGEYLSLYLKFEM